MSVNLTHLACSLVNSVPTSRRVVSSSTGCSIYLDMRMNTTGAVSMRATYPQQISSLRTGLLEVLLAHMTRDV